MLYRLKTLIAKNKLVKSVRNLFTGRKKKDAPDIRYQLIAKYAPGKSFIDIGCMWGVHGYFSFLAEELGARNVVAFDIYEETDEFKRIAAEKNSNVKYINGDINSKECIKNLGKIDVVYCTGLLYHVPDPLYTLSRFREICGDTLILGTAVIPEMIGIDNSAVFYPFLNESQRKIWNIEQGTQIGISTPFDPEQGYGNWIWGFSSSCLESMLKSSGFSISERHYGQYYSYVICKLSSQPFLPVSGDWSTPDFSKNVSKYKF